MLSRFRGLLTRKQAAPLGALPGNKAQSQATPDVNALRRRGNDFLASGDLAQAEGCFRDALKQDPDDVKCLVCLGYVLNEQGRLSEARIALKRAIGLSSGEPDAYEMHYLLGGISQSEGDLPDAVMHFRESLRLNPDFTRTCKELSDIYQRLGDAKAARELLQGCVQQRPECMDYRLWLTEICLREIDYEGVVTHLPTAIGLGAKGADSYMILGAALCRLGKAAEGAEQMALGVAQDPTLAVTMHYELGTYYVTAGAPQLGIRHLEQALAFKPDYLAAHSAILMALSYADDRDETVYREAAVRFAASAQRSADLPLQARLPRGDMRHKPGNGRLRVGFVSGDLLEHPVAYFLHDVLEHLDKQSIHVVAYSNNALDHDNTRSLKALFDEWHEIRALSDVAVAELIGAHKIDVLVDLGGHTGDNRLGLFARRPAPVQVTWLGYWASTGLPTMDFILADPVSVPEDAKEWFGETVYRLPHTRLCMSIPKTSRPMHVSPPPCLKNGYVTLGSFQQVAKITPHVLRVWAAVMDAVPDARLRLQTKGIGVPVMKDQLCRDMAAAGIDLARVDLLAAVDMDLYLEAHSEVDILLDSFPYPGGTTTAFALWMGVPTVTLAGDTMISRQGACMLHCVGLEEWIAHGEAEYVDIAKRMAMDCSKLAALRASLRLRALATPLFNAKHFAIDLQVALESMSRQGGDWAAGAGGAR